MLGQFIVFDKQVANELIKRGFPLREIGGRVHNIYYFDDLKELHEEIVEIKKKGSIIGTNSLTKTNRWQILYLEFRFADTSLL